MSIVVTSSESNVPEVMVRAYAGEPVKLLARGRCGSSAIEVVGHGGLAIGFPANDVYQFDQSLFRKLKASYSKGDSRALQETWERAIPYRAA